MSFLKIGKINLNTKGILEKGKIVKAQAAEQICNELLRKSEKYIPLDTGMLRDSGNMHSDPKSGYLMWKTPYAVKQWHKNKGRGLRGKKWALRAWADHGKFIVKSVKTNLRGQP